MPVQYYSRPMIPPSPHSAKLRDIMARNTAKQKTPPEWAEIRPGQSIELLKALHILTRDERMNQDSRRKLKQVYHLYQFIEPLLQHVIDDHSSVQVADIGAGKSYLGFILYDLFFKSREDDSI